MQSLLLCLEVRDSKQETREWGVANLTGSRDGEGDVGWLERSTSLLFISFSSSSLQNTHDMRSLIGNEPWSQPLSQDQQIATTYRLWRGESSPSRFPLSPLHLSYTSSLSPSVYGEFMIYPGQCGGQGYRVQRSILLLLMCQTPHLLYPILSCPDMPGPTNPPGVAMLTAVDHTSISVSSLDYHFLLLYFS